MKFAQVNINRGLQDKVHEVVEWAHKRRIDLVAVSETGLCQEYCFTDHRCAVVPYIDGWKWVRRARNVRGGGVGFLLREDVAFAVRRDLEEGNVEQIWIEVFRNKLPSILCIFHHTIKEHCACSQR